MSICEISTKVDLSFLEGLDTNDSVSRLILSNNLSYNLCFFHKSQYIWKKSFLSKIVYVEYNIFLCMVYKAITIIFTSN